MKTLQLGLIGAGRIGKLHARTISRQVPGARIRAISDIQPEGLQCFADEMGIERVTMNVQDILDDPEIDAVLICSSTATHADLAMAAARAGKHIFCEKPIDLSIPKIKAAIAVVRQTGVRMQVGFNRRFDHNFRRIYDLAAADILGDIHLLRITSRDPEPPPVEYIRQSGGIFMDMTIHDFDMALFLSGSPVTEVYAKAANLIDPAIGAAGDYDTAVITLSFKSGALGIIENSRKAVYGYDQRVELFGSKGSAEAFNDQQTNVKISTVETVSQDKPLYFFLERYTQSFRDELIQFVEAIKTGQETPVTVEDGLAPVRLAMAARLSVLEGRPVQLDEIEG